MKRVLKNILILFIGFILGVLGTVGGVAGVGYYMYKHTTVGSIYPSDGDEYVSEETRNLTIEQVVSQLRASPTLGTIVDLVPAVKTLIDTTLMETYIQENLQIGEVIAIDTSSEKFRSVSLTNIGQVTDAIEIVAKMSTAVKLLGPDTRASIQKILDLDIYNEGKYTATEYTGNFAFVTAAATDSGLYALADGVYTPYTGTPADGETYYKLAEGVTADSLEKYYVLGAEDYEAVYSVKKSTGAVTVSGSATGTVYYQEAAALKDVVLTDIVTVLPERLNDVTLDQLATLLPEGSVDYAAVLHALTGGGADATIADLAEIDANAVKLADLLEAANIMDVSSNALLETILYTEADGEKVAVALGDLENRINDLTLVDVYPDAAKTEGEEGYSAIVHAIAYKTVDGEEVPVKIGELSDMNFDDITLVDAIPDAAKTEGEAGYNAILHAIAYKTVDGEEVPVTIGEISSNLSAAIDKIAVTDVLGEPAAGSILYAISYRDGAKVKVGELSARVDELAIEDIIAGYDDPAHADYADYALMRKLVPAGSKISELSTVCADISDKVQDCTLPELGITFTDPLLTSLIPAATKVGEIEATVTGTGGTMWSVPLSTLMGTSSSSNTMLNILLSDPTVNLGNIDSKLNAISLEDFVGQPMMEEVEITTSVYASARALYTFDNVTNAYVCVTSGVYTLSTATYNYTGLTAGTYYRINTAAGMWFAVMTESLTTSAATALTADTYTANYGAYDAIKPADKTVEDLGTLDVPVSQMKIKTMVELGLISSANALLYDQTLSSVLV